MGRSSQAIVPAGMGGMEWPSQPEPAVLEGFSELARGTWTGETTSQNSFRTHPRNLFKLITRL